MERRKMRRTNLQIGLTVVLGLGAAGGMLIADSKGSGFSDGGDLKSPPNDDFRSSGFRMAHAGTSPGGCVGDFNNDGMVDGQDLAVLLGAWATNDCSFSIDGDVSCFIDGADLTVLLGNWGPCN